MCLNLGLCRNQGDKTQILKHCRLRLVYTQHTNTRTGAQQACKESGKWAEVITQRQEDGAAGYVMETSQVQAKTDWKSFMPCHFLQSAERGREWCKETKSWVFHVYAELGKNRLVTPLHPPTPQTRLRSTCRGDCRRWVSVMLCVPDRVGCVGLVTGQEPPGERPRPGL